MLYTLCSTIWKKKIPSSIICSRYIGENRTNFKKFSMFFYLFLLISRSLIIQFSWSWSQITRYTLLFNLIARTKNSVEKQRSYERNSTELGWKILALKFGTLNFFLQCLIDGWVCNLFYMNIVLPTSQIFFSDPSRNTLYTLLINLTRKTVSSGVVNFFSTPYAPFSTNSKMLFLKV